MSLDSDSARELAKDWAVAWNRRDVEAVLAHFADEVTFISPKAEAIVGNSRLSGKAALRAYWVAALIRIADLHFDLEHIAFDTATRTLTVIYESRLDTSRCRVSEVMRFDERDLIVHGEAFYGAQIRGTTPGTD